VQVPGLADDAFPGGGSACGRLRLFLEHRDVAVAVEVNAAGPSRPAVADRNPNVR